MKKHYITPKIKRVNVMVNEYMMMSASILDGTTDTQYTNRHRTWSSDERDEWDDEE